MLLGDEKLVFVGLLVGSLFAAVWAIGLLNRRIRILMDEISMLKNDISIINNEVDVLAGHVKRSGEDSLILHEEETAD